MLELLSVTVATSAIDSLNPIAITQQFVLQGLVKKRHHIWAFILATGFTNFLSGFLVYYGVAALFNKYIRALLSSYHAQFMVAELLLGIGLLVAFVYLLCKRKITLLQNKIAVLEGKAVENEDLKGVAKIKSVSPVSLFLLGVFATVCELTSAVPYFAFLAVLLSHQLSFFSVTVILLLYNMIYISPSAVLYFLYVKRQSQVDKIYHMFKSRMAKLATILTPVIPGGFGAFLIYHSLAGII